MAVATVPQTVQLGPCPRCEYDLSGLDVANCPECGLDRSRILANRARTLAPAGVRTTIIATCFVGELALFSSLGVYTLLYLRVLHRLTGNEIGRPPALIAFALLISLYVLPWCVVWVLWLLPPKPADFTDDPRRLRGRAKYWAIASFSLYMSGLWGVPILMGITRWRTLFGISRYGPVFACVEPALMLFGLAALHHAAAIACRFAAARADDAPLARRAASLARWLPAITLLGAATLGPVVSALMLNQLIRRLRARLRTVALVAEAASNGSN